MRIRWMVAAAGALVTVAVLAAVVTVAGSTEPVAGACEVHEPGAAPVKGYAGYTEHVTPTVHGFGAGSLAVTIVCETPGSAGDIITLILPNLSRGSQPEPGEYRVRSPADSLTTAQMVDPRVAWARVARGGGALLFMARGGTVRLVAVTDGVLEGAYQVAIASADSALTLPGARSEAGGTFRVDSAGRPILAPTVLGGAFRAVRTEADWRGR
jgi:hypothetical protein